MKNTQMRNNIIPPITDPLGKHWDQPDIHNFIMNEAEHVVMMTQKDFDKLAEYSCSLPSGTYDGKCWKKNAGAFTRPRQPDDWYLCWFSPHTEPNQIITINYRQIVII